MDQQGAYTYLPAHDSAHESEDRYWEDYDQYGRITSRSQYNRMVRTTPELKTSAFFEPTSMVKLEIVRPLCAIGHSWADCRSTTTSVELPLRESASLHTIFNGNQLGTNGDREEWCRLPGFSCQRHCNRQGFNLNNDNMDWRNRVNLQHFQGQSQARIGIYFNDQNNCDSPDSGRVVGGSSRSAVAGGAGEGSTSDLWVRILVLIPISMISLPPCRLRRLRLIRAHQSPVWLLRWWPSRVSAAPTLPTNKAASAAIGGMQ